MKIVLFILLLIAAAPVVGFTQIDDLMNDPDVVWIGEIELEYNFKPEKLNGEYFPESERRYEYRVRKSDFKQCGFENTLIDAIIDGVQIGTLPVYDKPSGKRLNKEEIKQICGSRLNTVLLSTPYNYEEKYMIVSNDEPISKLVNVCVIRQVWYYDVKNKQFANRTIGISFMIPAGKRSENANSLDREEEILYYVEFPNFTDAALQINSPDIPFCMETMETIDFSTFKVLKGNSHETFEQVFFQLPKEQEIDVFSVESGYCCNEMITQNEYNNIFEEKTDTLIVCFPDNIDETLNIIQTPSLSFTDYNDNYRVKQTWYFDSKSHQLLSKLNSIAPTKAVYDENGNFLYDHAIFYLCFSENAPTKDKRR